MFGSSAEKRIISLLETIATAVAKPGQMVPASKPPAPLVVRAPDRVRIVPEGPLSADDAVRELLWALGDKHKRLLTTNDIMDLDKLGLVTPTLATRARKVVDIPKPLEEYSTPDLLAALNKRVMGWPDYRKVSYPLVQKLKEQGYASNSNKLQDDEDPIFSHV